MTSQPHWYLDACEATRQRIKDRTARAMGAGLERMIHETRRQRAEDPFYDLRTVWRPRDEPDGAHPASKPCTLLEGWKGSG